MLKTYNAILQNDHLNWVDEVPDSANIRKSVKVHVTILENAESMDDNSRGVKMAKILEQIANRGTAFTEINDPVEWQKEIRQDRSLSNRE